MKKRILSAVLALTLVTGSTMLPAEHLTTMNVVNTYAAESIVQYDNTTISSHHEFAAERMCNFIDAYANKMAELGYYTQQSPEFAESLDSEMFEVSENGTIVCMKIDDYRVRRLQNNDGYVWLVYNAFESVLLTMGDEFLNVLNLPLEDSNLMLTYNASRIFDPSNWEVMFTPSELMKNFSWINDQNTSLNIYEIGTKIDPWYLDFKPTENITVTSVSYDMRVSSYCGEYSARLCSLFYRGALLDPIDVSIIDRAENLGIDYRFMRKSALVSNFKGDNVINDLNVTSKEGILELGKKMFGDFVPDEILLNEARLMVTHNSNDLTRHLNISARTMYGAEGPAGWVLANKANPKLSMYLLRGYDCWYLFDESTASVTILPPDYVTNPIINSVSIPQVNDLETFTDGGGDRYTVEHLLGTCTHCYDYTGSFSGVNELLMGHPDKKFNEFIMYSKDGQLDISNLTTRDITDHFQVYSPTILVEEVQNITAKKIDISGRFYRVTGTSDVVTINCFTESFGMTSYSQEELHKYEEKAYPNPNIYVSGYPVDDDNKSVELDILSKDNYIPLVYVNADTDVREYTINLTDYSEEEYLEYLQGDSLGSPYDSNKGITKFTDNPSSAEMESCLPETIAIRFQDDVIEVPFDVYEKTVISNTTENKSRFNVYASHKTIKKWLTELGYLEENTENPVNPDAEYTSNFSTRGDINTDDIMDIRDVTTLNQYIIKAVSLSDQQLSNADVVRDGKIDITDLGQLKKCFLKLITVDELYC